MATPYISMAGIGKSFGPVHALKSVNLTVYPGEIHALLGENGAGKSTLMKVLSGIHEPTKGTITINNINYNKLDHKLAAQLGIGIIYQELSVIDELTGNDSNLLIVFYVQIMPDDFVMQLHR
ncbi:ATP-binding cassette domain-containing protein, partial [Escherichia coli]|uniref:ATP-binding cassette domain-containing protein n=2 Tax=Escherichia coli TaxID=562 RepID=UPI0020001538|nr:ATP-binding cassette domain-containing protein [Escherichia coli]